jgi:hypothetical protein
MGINNTEIDHLNIVEECFAIGNAVEGANKEVHEPKKIYDAKKTYLSHLKGKIWLEYKTGKRTIDGLEGKATDKAVDSARDADLEYLEAMEAMNKAYHDYMVADDWASGMESKKKGLDLVSKYVLAGWFSALKIADVSSIENFANGSSASGGKSVVAERTALREERKRRRGKEEDKEIS